MSKYLVQIENEFADLPPGTEIPLSFQLIDVADPTTPVRANFTIPFMLPYTQKNRNIMELAELLESSTRLPYQVQQAQLYAEGIPLLKTGVSRILKAENKGYKVSIYGDAIDFFDLIKNQNIKSLDWTDLEHKLQLNDGAVTDGIDQYISTDFDISYPAMDWGVIGTPPGLFLPSQWFTFSVKGIFDRLFQEIGWTYDGSMILTPEFQTLHITETKQLKSEIEEASSGEASGFNASNPSAQNYTNNQVQTVQFPDDSAANDGDFDPLTGIFTAKFSGVAGFQVNGTVTSNRSGFLYLRASSRYIAQWEFSGTGSPETINLDGVTNLIPGEEVFVQISTSHQQNVATSVDAGAQFIGNLAATTSLYGDTILVNEYAPDILFSEFVKEIVSVFNAVPVVDANKKNVSFVLLKDFINQTPVDWSDKSVDQDNQRTEQDFSGLNRIAQNNLVRSADDPFFVGQYTLTIDNPQLPETEEYLTLDFGVCLPAFWDGVTSRPIASSGLVFALLTNQPFRINTTGGTTILKGASGDGDFSDLNVSDLIIVGNQTRQIASILSPTQLTVSVAFTGGSVGADLAFQTVRREPRDIAPQKYILVRDNDAGEGAVDWNDQNKTVNFTDYPVGYTYDPDPAQPDFREIFDIYHQPWFDKMLRSYRRIEAFFLLNLADIIELDLTRPVYIDRFGLFLIGKIDKYVAERSTKVILYQIKD